MQIRGVAARWRAQYRLALRQAPDGGTAAIARQLDALDPETATAADVTRIIGNGSWVSLVCDECGEDVPAAVAVGQPPDYESATATVCEPCLRKALALFGSKP
jgi:hypothetical protein